MTEPEVDSSRATARLIWAACRPVPDETGVRSAVDGGADLRLAAAIALLGRAGPLLWRTLAGCDLLDRLGDARAVLEEEHAVRRAQALLVVPLAVAASIDPLTEAGLEPLVFKGPVVAERYPSPGLRPMDDLDVVLPPADHERALAALEGAGWTQYVRPGHHHDTVLFHRNLPGLALELHRGLESWRDHAHRLTVMDLWRARRPAACMGTWLYALPPELELLALATHAGKPFHTFQRLIWSVDFAVVLDSAGAAFDWDELARTADRARCRTVVAVALRHARRLGADVPDELLDLRVGRYRRAALAPLVHEEWPLVPHTTSGESGIIHRLRYALWDDRLRHVRLFLGEISTGGLLRVPLRLVEVLQLGVRRWWRWRRLVPSGDADDGARQRR